MSVLVAVAHGSRDPRSAETVAAVVEQVRLRRPDLDVRTAFLDLSEPGLGDVLDEVAAAGHTSAVVVPLLLGSAFHARVDLPGLLDDARGRHPNLALAQAAVLGDDRRLVDALRSRIVDAGVDPDDPEVGIAVAAVGSSFAPANQRTRAIADRILLGTRWTAAITCFATAQDPGPAEALARLSAAGAEKVVVAPWFLAPGLLTDRVFAAVAELRPDAVTTDVIGDHSAVAEVVSARYDDAVGGFAARARKYIA
ncbi:sirohydrochlorin chelatase [Rhodococcoides kyotonense]|uniref:Sirohydrochlorin ferrochelatase n=1 Tax=Rhodococcoides kyotonense TaxID=398843 RepID=A0A239HLQ4_9NOCA|nr:sirohydrochlorin chelatase [Rhodococcus kyotonensis]SNS81184.1 Sirohydrochlorin ferrochelatase [Rhodococcus kyotonensis]